MNTYNRINWADGMLINKEHFKGMENYLLSNIYRTNHLLLGGNYYGIINPGNSEGSDYPCIKLTIDASDNKNQKIIIEQIEFLALTPDGTFLDISNDCFHHNYNVNDGSMPVSKPVIVDVEEQKIGHGDPLFLVLLTLPYETKGFGNAPDAEEPMRLPFCRPISELRCVSSTSDIENIVGANHFPIAKIKILNHRLKIDSDYIPPCYTISAHHLLVERFFSIKESIMNLGGNIDVFLKNNPSPGDGNINFIRELYTHLYFKIIDTIQYLNDTGESLNPKEIIRFIKTISIQFKTLLLCNSESYTFFMDEWNSKYGINFQNITNDIETLKKIKYYDINDVLLACQRILDDYLIKITAISSYGQKRVSPKRPPVQQAPPDDDYINM